MKVILLLLLIVALAAGGYVYMQSSQLAQAPIGALFSGDAQSLVKFATSFMEDIKFKDFKAAAKYSLPEQQDKYDIAALIEKLFHIKPELLDIQSYEITHTELDSSGQRAKVQVKSQVKLLNSKELKSPEMNLYFKKQSGQWYMDLASSLD